MLSKLKKIPNNSQKEHIDIGQKHGSKGNCFETIKELPADHKTTDKSTGELPVSTVPIVLFDFLKVRNVIIRIKNLIQILTKQKSNGKFIRVMAKFQ
jgi:hypothetical protein